MLQSTAIVATLPSGAALANASTQQCLEALAKNTENAEIEFMTTHADEYVRAIAFKRQCHDGAYYCVFDQWYDADGLLVGRPPEGPEKLKKTDEQVHVAVAFDPNDDMTGVMKLSIKFDGFDVGETALTGTCWASVDPTFRT